MVTFVFTQQFLSLYYYFFFFCLFFSDRFAGAGRTKKSNERTPEKERPEKGGIRSGLL